MLDETLLKILGLVVVVIVSAANVMKFNPLKEWKEDIKNDLDILDKLDPEDENYELVKSSVYLSIMVAYSRDHKPWYSWYYKKNRPVYFLFLMFFTIVVSIIFI